MKQQPTLVVISLEEAKRQPFCWAENALKTTMKTDFKFSNLLGTVYCQGNLLFNPEGTHLFSPVGNRVTVFDLVKYAPREPRSTI